jgi:hypothetical protein
VKFLCVPYCPCLHAIGSEALRVPSLLVECLHLRDDSRQRREPLVEVFLQRLLGHRGAAGGVRLELGEQVLAVRARLHRHLRDTAYVSTSHPSLRGRR